MQVYSDVAVKRTPSPHVLYFHIAVVAVAAFDDDVVVAVRFVDLVNLFHSISGCIRQKGKLHKLCLR